MLPVLQRFDVKNRTGDLDTYMQKIFKKFAEIANETLKKKIQQLSYTKNHVKKADICSIMLRLCLLGFSWFGRDLNLCSKSET